MAGAAEGTLTPHLAVDLSVEEKDALPPAAFAVTTEEYRNDKDVLSRFLEEECEVTGHSDDREVRADLYAAYRSFVRDNGESAVSPKKFANAIKARSARSDPKSARVVNRRGGTEFVRFWLGIRYKSNEERREEWERQHG